MNNLGQLALSGLFLLLAGVVMVLSPSIPFAVAKLLVPLLFVGGGILAWMYGSANPSHRLAKPYHRFHGLGLIVFGVVIGVYPNELAAFLRLVVYYMLFFGLVEVLVAFSALNTGLKLNTRILLSRFAIGFVNLIGAIFILALASSDESTSLIVAGVLVAHAGLSSLVLARVLKNRPALA